MKRAPNDASHAGKSKVIEIVGPAGAGKTTLYHALHCYPDWIRPKNFPDVHKWNNAPFYICNGLQLIPCLMRLRHSDSRQLTRREFAWLSILHGWSSLLGKESQHGDKAIILDQGPVYLLAEMLLFGPQYLRQSSADKFWPDLYGRWGATLDIVLLLDAADDILLERIRTRQQDLVVKNQPDTIVYEYLNSYRIKYELLLSVLTANNNSLKVLRFNTGCQSTQNIVDELFSELAAE